MCRSIKQLRYVDHHPTDEEIRAGALQSVHKVTGYRQPSRANQVAFSKAVAEITRSTKVLLENIGNAGEVRRDPTAD